MNKEQAMLKVADLEKELAQLKQIINEPEPVKSFKRWRAELGRIYYRFGIDGDTDTSREVNDLIDNFNYSIGNYFQTKEEAEEYRDKLIFNQSVIDRIAELNEGWTPDWSDEYQEKFRLLLKIDNLKITRSWSDKYTSDNKHFKSREIGETILKEFDNEKLIKWFI